MKASYYILIGSLLAALLLFSGCCGECPSGGTEVKKSISFTALPQSPITVEEPPVAYEIVKATLNAPVPDAQKITAKQAGGVITVGLVALTLKQAIAQLSNLTKTLSGELKSLAEQLQFNAQNVLADFDHMLGKKLEYTFDRLNETERRAVEDAEALIKQMQTAVMQIETNALDAARISIAEADITAYNSLYALPCRDQQPRLVYANPNIIRIGIDAPEVRVRGNFLVHGESNVKVNESLAQVIAANANEYVVRIPDAVLNAITAEQSVGISATPAACRVKKFGGYEIVPTDKKLSVAVKLQPKINFTVYAHIKPTAEIPEIRRWPFSLNVEDEDCDADYAVDREYCLPSGWEVIDWEVKDIEANCGSHVSTSRLSGARCVKVDATLEGCGYNMVGLNCKGRGWVRYTLYVRGKSYVRKPLAGFTAFAHAENEKQRTFSFQYPYPIPTDSRNVKWPYDVRVVIIQGGRERVIQLSDVNPNAEGIKTRIDNGKLTVEF